ncbi:MAG: EamA family transporter RarD, partial [Proteobacteria bacterium]|nr:EamA family transporter RarD [Pseudomonadota bacterium]
LVLASCNLAARLALAAVLVSLNWIVFMTAVSNGFILECSLGYFINPLVNVVLGVLFLGERLTPLQWAAVALAMAGIVNLSVGLGVLPWISLTLALLFGFYGLVRKTAPIGAAGGLLAETLFLLPFALAYLGYLQWTGEAAFLAHDWGTDWLLIMAGLVTAVPLILFTAAARRLRYATVGFYQYIAPTGQFALAVLVYGETLTPAHVVTFGLIWAALAIYSVDMFRRRGAARS